MANNDGPRDHRTNNGKVRAKKLTTPLSDGTNTTTRDGPHFFIKFCFYTRLHTNFILNQFELKMMWTSYRWGI
jgi:hypothetical protein